MPKGDTPTSKRMRRASMERTGLWRENPSTILKLHKSQMSTFKFCQCLLESPGAIARYPGQLAVNQL
ncbi:hypothetical protein TNCV_985091 [Trichonephila clavipes]|nr:hypothetical protein TNCV_985091 [Trichonephila clavipes]